MNVNQPLPSIRSLRRVFGDRATEARAILEADRLTLEGLPGAREVVAQSYGAPLNSTLRLEALAALDPGLYGVEACQRPHRLQRMRGWIEYINTGDLYNETVYRYRGRYVVGCVADLLERGC